MTPITTKPNRRAATWTTAAMAAAAGSAQAELVQIDLIGNQITAGGGNQLFADLDGDGIADVTLTSSSVWDDLASTSSDPYNGASVSIDSQFASALTIGSSTYAFTTISTSGPGSDGSGTGLMAISLSGKPGVNAWLEVERRASGAGIGQNAGDPETGVYLTRVIYDPNNASTPDVTEQYTSIGSTENGVFTSADGPEVTAFTVSGGTATISIKGDPLSDYTCKSSTTLSGFTEIIPTSGSTTTDVNGNATFGVDATGPNRFYVVEDSAE